MQAKAAQDAEFRVVEELGRDDWQVLSRALRAADGRPVLLARARSVPPLPREAAVLSRQQEVLGQLAGPGVPRVLSRDSFGLVLADGGGLPLPRLLAAGPLAPERFADLALQLTAAVGRLHQSGLIHRGLRSAAVLAHPQTGEAQIVDWSTVSRLTEDAEGPGARSPIEPLGVCLSPEQTGRMNRAVDHRTDLYALGAIFYELLTGGPPFETRDPLELVHWHIARAPTPPAAVHPGVPGVLSDITSKLLAKMAEDRYQSARGLQADLQRFADLWKAGERDPAFPLASEDGPERFTVPQRLYGRERQVAELLEGFEQSAAGRPVFALVSGYAGVGKTAVVAEVARAIAGRRGRMVSGKFDQIERGTPYSALAQALQSLCREAGAEPGAQATGAPRADLAPRLRAALGPHAGVVAALVPELEALLGPIEPVPALGPGETQNRFALAFQRLLSVFADDQRPLAIFLDDLQWADMATLRLLPHILEGTASLPIFWIGAFRDNEVGADHPLGRFRADLPDSSVQVKEVSLQPLRRADLISLLEEALGQQGPAVAALARLLQEKTDGNPFFLIQSLKSLAEQGLVSFDPRHRRWAFDIDRLEAAGEAAGITDNVLDLMTRKLHHLPGRTREVITAAACIGNVFSLETLALVREQSQRTVAAELWEAIAEGLVRPTSARYELLAGSEAIEDEQLQLRFLHDRVQQAAYALIPEDQRTGLHLRLGRLLLRGHGDRPDRLFEIVGHLNRAHQLISDPLERRRLAELDLAAGRQARGSGAVQTALDLFTAGRSLLPPALPEGDDLGWTLALESAECQLQCGELDPAQATLDLVITRAPSAALVGEAYRIRVVHHENTGRFVEAARVGLEALARMNLPLPPDAEARATALEEELRRIDALVAGRPLERLAALPPMQEPATKIIASLIVAMWPAAFLANEPHLTALLSARLVRLSLEQGNTEESAIGYLTHGITENVRTGDYRRGNAFGQLGLAVNERFGDVRLRAKVHHLFGSFLSAWGQPLPLGRRHAQEAHRAAVETGDFTYAGRAAFMETWYAFFPGEPLDRFEALAQQALAFLERIRHPAIARATQILLQWSRALRGQTRDVLSLSQPAAAAPGAGGFDEEACEAQFQQMPIFLGFLGVARLGLAITFDDPPRAWRWCERVAQAFAGSAEQIWHSAFDFYRGLAAAGLFPGAAPAQRPALLAALDAARAALQRRAAGCPENFEHQQLLLAAERARIGGALEAAEPLYAQAAMAAERSGYLNDRALIAERSARFQMERGQAAGARACMTTALDLYRRWGATAKVSQLRTAYPDLLDQALPGVRTPAPAPTSEASFDAASALKAAQAIAGELELARLLPRLVQIVVENAGAERGVLIEATGDDDLAVRAEGAVASEARGVPGVPLGRFPDLPAALIGEVHRTRTPVLIPDARSDRRGQSEPYLRRRQPRSILCVPIVRQGASKGVLYLENTLSADVFSPARAEVVQVLASQAAISLENARLYQELAALTNRLRAENVYLQEEIRTQHNFEEIVGSSPELLEVLRKVEKVAPLDSTVLVLGETGTGKELVARAIHSRSRRRDRPLVKVNCAAIASGLVESELFGHVKGAFTGALQKRVGRFELADGGTIFLDEVAELPLDTQAKLLRVLQEQELEPVGSSRTQKVDVRVIAATNRDLQECVRAGRFRADLLYRLDVFPVHLPPLRRRREDIPQLVSFLLARLSKRLGRPLEGFRREDMERLTAWSWPGNVRELQNVIERAVILAPGSIPVLDADRLAGGLDAAGPTPAPVERSGEGGFQTIEEMERRHIVSVLESTAWLVEGARGAASILGLHPNTLRSRMKKLGIRRARQPPS